MRSDLPDALIDLGTAVLNWAEAVPMKIFPLEWSGELYAAQKIRNRERKKYSRAGKK